MIKPMIGYEDRYTIEDTGVVRNKHGKELGGYTSDNYNYIKTYDGKKHRLHRLVAQNFIPNPEEYSTVDHIDEDKSNNCVSNLRWCTEEMNRDYHYEKHGKGKYNTIKANKPTMKEHIEKVGKKVTVNGELFPSAGSAAKYIADIEGKNRSTISKEIRRYLAGKRPSWVMYEKYLIL